MNIVNQVCSPVQAKKLKELGIKIDSNYTWINCKKTSVDESEWNFLLFQETGCDCDCIWYPENDCYDDYGQDGEINETAAEYRAYTTSEIISIIPSCINKVYYNEDLNKYYTTNYASDDSYSYYETVVRALADYVIQQLECKDMSEEFNKN